VLTRQMTGPVRDVEVEACDPGRFLDELDDLAQRPR